MKDGFVKAAVSTPELRVADCLFNEKKIKEKAEKLAEKGARLIVFPEFALTGYTCQDLFLQDTLLDGATEALKQLAVDTAGIKAVVVVGLPLEMQGRLYNVAAALNQGKILGFVPKAICQIMENFMRPDSLRRGRVRTQHTVFRMAQKFLLVQRSFLKTEK